MELHNIYSGSHLKRFNAKYDEGDGNVVLLDLHFNKTRLQAC